MDYRIGPGESFCLPFNFIFWEFATERALRLEFLCVARMGIKSGKKIYEAVDLAPGKKLIFTATGVTDGSLLRRVRFFGGSVRTQSQIMSLDEHDVRFIDSVHIENEDVKIRFY